MIVEMRTYCLRLGSTSKYFQIYEEQGLEIQKQILGNLLGYYSVEIGSLNNVIHLWGYPSLDERTNRRRELYRNDDWLRCAREISSLIVSQSSEILKPAPFFRSSMVLK